MGLFSKTKPIVVSKKTAKKKTGTIPLKNSSSSTDEDDRSSIHSSPTAGKPTNNDKKKEPKQKFWKLHEDLKVCHKSNKYNVPSTGVNPPSGAKPKVDAVEKGDLFVARTRGGVGGYSKICTKRTNFLSNFQRLNSVDDEDDIMAKEIKQNLNNHHNTPPRSKKKAHPNNNKKQLFQSPIPVGHPQSKKIANSHSIKASPGLDLSRSYSSSTGYGEYQPPNFSIENAVIKPTESFFYLQDEDHYDASVDSSAKFQGFMQNIINNSFSEETFDVATLKSASKSHYTTQSHHHRFHKNKSPVPGHSSSPGGNVSASSYSESGFPTSTGGHDFRQIVFSREMDQIKEVAVTKSDAGSSDFSDFVKAASNLASAFSAEKVMSNKKPGISKRSSPHPSWKNKKTPTKKSWPKLENSKHIKDTPAYTPPRSSSKRQENPAAITPPRIQPHQAYKITSSGVKPNLLPSRNMIAKGSSPCPWDEVTPAKRAIEESQPLPGDDDGGFSVSSMHSGATQKSRQDFQAAIRAKSKAAPYTESQRRSKTTMIPTDRSVDVSSNVSVANATFSEQSQQDDMLSATDPSVDPFNIASTDGSFKTAQDFLENSFGKDVEDPFHIGDPVAQDPFDEVLKRRNSNDRAWDVETDPFAQNTISTPHHQIVKSDVKKASSTDDALIASIRKATAKPKVQLDPEVNSHKQDPSPGSVKKSASDSVVEYSQNNPIISAPTKTPPNAIPTNAILGSMLFRQAKAANDDANNYSLSSSKRKQRDGGRGDYGPTGDGSSAKNVPNSVHASDAVSVVSSVTEEASSFYEKSLGGGSGNWNREAQQVLNHYNVKKTLQARDTNAYYYYRQNHQYGRQNRHQTFLSPLQEEPIINMYQSEI